MLHTVVIDAEALAALDQIFARQGEPLPRSPVVDRRHGRRWHAVPIPADSIAAIQCLRRSDTQSFNDCLRLMLDLPPLGSRDEHSRSPRVTRPAIAQAVLPRAAAVR